MKVLDASAVLALLKAEPGAQRVSQIMAGARLLRVNLAEVLQKAAQLNMEVAGVYQNLLELGIVPEPLEDADALQIAQWYLPTRKQGLSLGDLACLALAQRLKTAALTTDRAWAALRLGVSIEVIR